MSFFRKFEFSVLRFFLLKQKKLRGFGSGTTGYYPTKTKFFSVTFGAGGSLQQKSLEVVRQFVAHGIAATPHISCVNITRQRLEELLNEYKQSGIKQLLVIQGDLPSDATPIEIEFNYATESITAIRAMTGNYFHIIVAALPEFHPRAISPAMDI